MTRDRKVTYTLFFICLLLVSGIFMRNFHFGSPSNSEMVFTIITEYFGANAKEIERVITIPIENGISDIPGIREVESSSEFARSRITVFTKKNTDNNLLYTDIKERVDRIRANFPKAVQKTRIQSSDSTNRPFFIVSFESGILGLSELGNYIDAEIKPLYQRIRGTGEIEIGGRGIQEVIIDLDYYKTSQYGINSFDVSNALQSSYIRLPVGKTNDKKTTAPLFYDSQILAVDDFNNLTLNLDQNNSIKLSDIAQISKHYRKPEQISRIDGKERIILYIYSGGDVNPLILSNNLIETSKSVSNLGLSTVIVYDKADEIRKGLNRILISMAISMLSLFIFIGVFIPDTSSRLILSLSIPLTIYISISLLSLFGIPVDANIISGLIIGSGLIIDNYLVIFDFLKKAKEKTIHQVISPLVSATLTTMIVFLPLLILNSISASVQSISVSICIMLGASLFLSFTFLPRPLIASRNKRKKTHALVSLDKISALFVSFAKKMLRYRNILMCIYIFIIISVPALLILSQKEFSPVDNDNVLFAHVEMPSGSTIAETDRTVLPYIKMFQNVNGVLMVENSSKRGNGTISITFDTKRTTLNELQYALEHLTRNSAKAQFFYGLMQSTGVYRIRFTLTGYDHEILRSTVKEIADSFSEKPWVRNVIYHFKENPPAVIFTGDVSRISSMSLTSDHIANTLRWNIQGPVSIKWIDSGHERDVRIMSQIKNKLSPFNLGTIPVITHNGISVRMDQLGSFNQHSEPDRLYRENRQNSINFSIEADRIGLNEMAKNIRHMLSTVSLPSGYGIFSDKSLDTAISNYNMMFIVFLLAVFLIYVVLAIQSESYTQPIIIITAIPFSSFFPLFVMWLVNQPITSASLIAIIILAGMSVNNYILLIDEIKKTRYKYDMSDAIINAIRQRFSPLFLSCGTTIIAAIPVLLSAAPFSDFPSSLAMIISLGVSGSFIGTFIFFPSVVTRFFPSSE